MNYFFLIFLFYIKILFSFPGLIIEPISNLYIDNPNFFDEKTKKISNNYEIYSFYENKSKFFIKRIIQGLYNEIVDIIYEEGDFLQISHPYFYYKESSGKLSNLYWIFKDDVVFIDEIHKKHKKYLTINQINKNDIYTLILPININGILFSVGTEFIIKKDKKSNENDLYKITYLLNDKGKIKINYYFIKKEELENYFIKKLNNYNILEKRNLFINLIKNNIDKANSLKASIPYLWGGSTIGYVYNIASEYLIEDEKYWTWKEREGNKSKYIYGCDCSALVALFARICGFPFFLRNSLVQKLYLKDVVGEIKNGDIIWIPGHVLIIDAKGNNCIESAGYSSGFCSVVINPFINRFKGVNNINELYNLFKKNLPLILIDKTGKETEYRDYKILSLESCFDIDYNI